MRETLTQRQIKTLTCITRKNIYEQVILVEKIVMNTFGLPVVQKILLFGVDIIDPAIVEEALLGHEAIAFAGAIGQPDQHSGELPCVYVELVGGATVTPEELDEFCKENVKEPGALPKHI